MGLVVNSNIASLNAQRNLERSSGTLSKALERLSSGLRINRAGKSSVMPASQLNGETSFANPRRTGQIVGSEASSEVSPHAVVAVWHD